MEAARKPVIPRSGGGHPDRQAYEQEKGRKEEETHEIRMGNEKRCL
jgi:hypothetical protein